MNISPKNLEEARKLLNELEQLDSALEVLSHYDSKVSVQFWTGHNGNTKQPKTVLLPISSNVLTSVVSEIKDRRVSIKQQLEKM